MGEQILTMYTSDDFFTQIVAFSVSWWLHLY